MKTFPDKLARNQGKTMCASRDSKLFEAHSIHLSFYSVKFPTSTLSILSFTFFKDSFFRWEWIKTTTCLANTRQGKIHQSLTPWGGNSKGNQKVRIQKSQLKRLQLSRTVGQRIILCFQCMRRSQITPINPPPVTPPIPYTNKEVDLYS